MPDTITSIKWNLSLKLFGETETKQKNEILLKGLFVVPSSLEPLSLISPASLTPPIKSDELDAYLNQTTVAIYITFHQWKFEICLF